MCKLMEDMRNEAAHDKVKEKAILMLKNGKISFDEISVFFSELSVLTELIAKKIY